MSNCLFHQNSIICPKSDTFYIGQTKQLLKYRIRQHKADPNNITHKKKTALTSHTYEERHKFNFEGTTILDYENNNYRKNISEMIHITINKTVNYKKKCQWIKNHTLRWCLQEINYNSLCWLPWSSVNV